MGKAVVFNEKNHKRETRQRFSYRIRIENLSPHHVQLVGRVTEIEEVQDIDDDATNNEDFATSPKKTKHTSVESVKVSQVGKKLFLLSAFLLETLSHLNACCVFT